MIDFYREVIDKKGGETIMKQKTYLLFSLILILVIVAGCSSNEADEIVEVHNDFYENVAQPMEELGDEFDEATMQIEMDEPDMDEFISFMEDDIGSSIDELKTYVEDYDEPSTDEAKNYYNELTDAFNVIFEGLDKSIEMTVGAAEESLSETELMDLMTELEDLEVEADEKKEKLEEMREDYVEEYDIEFEDMEDM